MLKVGVTGGIGSGKTAFCKMLEEQGAFVIYADDFAKELMQSDEQLRLQIKKTFGDEAYHADGTLNRSYLAIEAFAKGRIQELNELVHPLLWKRLKSVADKKAKAGEKLFIVEAAILLNNGRPNFLDQVILLHAGSETRTQRVVKRDSSSPDQVLERMNKQPHFEKLSHLADIEVYNMGSLEELRAKAESVYKLLSKKAK